MHAHVGAPPHEAGIDAHIAVDVTSASRWTHTVPVGHVASAQPRFAPASVLAGGAHVEGAMGVSGGASRSVVTSGRLAASGWQTHLACSRDHTWVDSEHAHTPSQQALPGVHAGLLGEQASPTTGFATHPASPVGGPAS
jgi:hypothetical protein